MGSVIKSCFAAAVVPQSYMDMAAQASRSCLAQADIPLQDVDLLINFGVFRDDNMIEPAIAPLIQQKLGLNLDPVRHAHLHRTTLAFDINDGANGFLSAARVADSFLKTGAARLALLVGGDIHPSKTAHPDLPFQPVASAVLLAYNEDERRGFQQFHFQTSAAGCHGLSANVDVSRHKTGNRQRLHVVIPQDYPERLEKMATGMLADLMAQGKLSPDGITCLIASQHDRNFGQKMARAAGLDGHVRMMDESGQQGDGHTSALPLGYQHLIQTRVPSAGEKLLFVAAGAGLQASCALYTF